MKTKRVESTFVACLDPSSILGDSTALSPKIKFILGDIFIYIYHVQTLAKRNITFIDVD